MIETNKQYSNDEIDLSEVFLTIWEGRWKVFSLVGFAVVLTFIYQILFPAPTFKAVSQIKPIPSKEAELYSESNAHGIFEVTPSLLIDLYIEEWRDIELLEKRLRDLDVINVDELNSEEELKKKIADIISAIEILPPSNADGKSKGPVKEFWTIEHEYDDEVKWKAFLAAVDGDANNNVRDVLQLAFETSLFIEKNKIAFEVEDTQLKIENAIADYDRVTSDRLAFLREQAAIAKKLGIAKNTIEAQTFNAQNGMVANVNTNTPFYMRGYDAIEKEIELIQSRQDKEPFIKGLLELQQKLRELKQNKVIDRAEELFSKTPVVRSNMFTATGFNPDATAIEYNKKKILQLVLAIFLGGIVGIFYIFVSNAITNRNK